MKIRMKNSVSEGIAKKVINDMAGRLVRIEARRLEAMKHQIVVIFYCPQIRQYRMAFKELGNKNAPRGVLPDDFGHTLMEVVSRITSELFHVACFTAVIEFF